MDKRQELISQMIDLSNEIEWFNRPILEERLKEYPLSEIELIEKIGTIPNANVTKLASASYMTRGAISKLTKKLLSKDLIESYQIEDNKKEIYFRLTSKGEKIRKVHSDLHMTFLQRDKIVFEGMTNEEFDTIFRFIGKYREHIKRITEK
ncbi:MarR family transcriptional regulator [Vagococcus fluvialis]|uniref:MarR family winged helix-turn-helix transcriptional regulator n=1 Tax=Vagococcus fluvialis TaxID=2738 RepID=UPI001A8F9D5D|nr:MarR family transcriptional regulator [Vagococcus fluvialis]MBO0427780.1 MarR family transcriptional regulator [Vagococcus fluvialis]